MTTFPILVGLILGTAVCGVRANQSCCYPEKMEGTIQIIETRKMQYVAFDYATQRLLRSSSNDSAEFDVLNLKTDTLYAFSSNGCKAVAKVPVRHGHNRCLGDDLLVSRNFAFGNGIEVLKYMYMEPNSEVTQYMHRVGEFCFPVINYSVVNTEVISTIIFLNMKAGLSTDNINRSLDDCQPLDL